MPPGPSKARAAVIAAAPVNPVVDIATTNINDGTPNPASFATILSIFYSFQITFYIYFDIHSQYRATSLTIIPNYFSSILIISYKYLNVNTYI